MVHFFSFKVSILLTGLLLLLTVTITLLNPPFQLYPELPADLFSYSRFSDRDNGGNSQILEFRDSQEVLSFRFILKAFEHYSYAGFNMKTHTPKGINLSAYNRLSLKTRSLTGSTLKLQLKLFIEDFTNPKDFTTYLFLETPFSPAREFREQSFSLDEFETTSWWLRKNDINSEITRPTDLSRLEAVEILSDESHALNRECHIEIACLAFEKELAPLYLICGMLCLGHLVSAIGFKFLRFKKKSASVVELTEQQILAPYKHPDLSNREDLEKKAVFDCILSCYTNPDFSLEYVSAQAGISRKRISELIKREYKMAFKPYINMLRIKEAKRLLKTTDRQVTEIAFSLGYNSSSHFYRAFKQATKISPSEFKKKM